MNLKERMDALSIWEPNSGCRLWLGTLHRDHGAIKVGGKSIQVHRLAWEMERGPIPNGLWVLHNCGVGICFNVEHLRLGMQAANAADRKRHGGYVGRPGGGLLSRTFTALNPHKRITPLVDDPLDQGELRRILDYDAGSGTLRWRVRADRDQDWNGRCAGEVAGSVLRVGYRYINIRGTSRLAHRLIWTWVTGEEPKGQIDHVNGDRADNRWCNLRLATQRQNSANQGLRRNNTSGVKGVSWDARRRGWYAYITISGRMKALGRYPTLAEAVATRRAAEAEHHGEFARSTA